MLTLMLSNITLLYFLCFFNMARLYLPNVIPFSVFLIVVSLFSPVVLMREPPPSILLICQIMKQTQPTLNRDFASLVFTMSLGLPSIVNFTIPPFSSCYVMSLLSNMIVLPSNLTTLLYYF